MDAIYEIKELSNSLKDVDVKKRIVTGYLSAFDNTDAYNDVIVKGAFTKSINERIGSIYFLNQHRWDQPHGKFTVLHEDDKGLYFESAPMIDTTYSTDFLKLYEAGIINEHSIGYTTVKSDEKDGVRILKEIKLYEGSNVTMGANSQTPFLGLKTSKKDIEDKIKNIIFAMKGGTFTDETFQLLEIALKQLESEAYILGQKTPLITEPPKALETPEPVNFAEIINKFNLTI